MPESAATSKSATSKSFIPALPPDMVEVYDPITKRFLFRYSAIRRIVEHFHRGVKSSISLDALERDPTDPSAAVTTSRY